MVLHAPELVLQVIQPGSRSSFRRRVVESLISLTGSHGGFFFLGRDDLRAYGDGTRMASGKPLPIEKVAGLTLSQALGFDAKSVVETQRRVYVADELYPADERARLPYFSSHALPDATDAMLVFLHEGGVLFGVAGVEIRGRRFAPEDKAKLEAFAPIVVTAARTQMAYDELAREAAALRALGKASGTLFVVDRDKKCVLWAANRSQGIEWMTDVAPIEELVVQAGEQYLEAKKTKEALPTPPRLPSGTVMAVAKIEGDPVFGAARCAVVRIEEDPGSGAALAGLSRREREIARLLIAGYSGVNVAAIAGLSENTVRTYVRRLYAKVGVANRADLVRKLMSPEPQSSAPPSQIAPPPDSALVDGDDTLD